MPTMRQTAQRAVLVIHIETFVLGAHPHETSSERGDNTLARAAVGPSVYFLSALM